MTEMKVPSGLVVSERGSINSKLRVESRNSSIKVLNQNDSSIRSKGPLDSEMFNTCVGGTMTDDHMTTLMHNDADKIEQNTQISVSGMGDSSLNVSLKKT
jgi:hypothetical protein